MTLQPVKDAATPVQMRDTAGQDRVVEQPTGRRRAVWGALIIVIVALGWWLISAASTYMRADSSVSRDRLRIASVTRGEFVRDLAIQGVIVAAIKPTVFAPSAGRVSVLVNPGDSVVEGQVLAVIDSPELKNSLAQAQSLLVSQEIAAERERIRGRQEDLENQQASDLARVDVTTAERELRRAEASWEYQVISRQDLEKAIDDLAKAELAFAHKQADARLFRERQAFEERTQALEVEQQQLRVQELGRQMDALSVRSPVAGVVGNLLVDDKAAVTADAALLSVVDLSRLELEVPLAQTYADDVSVGMPAEISYSGQRFPALISAISPEVENNTVATRLRFADQQPAGLRQNQRLTGRIELETVADALLLPRGPFYNSDGGRAAYRIDGDFAVRTPIQTGAASATMIQVLDGLGEGDQVIVSATDGFESAEEILITD